MSTTTRDPERLLRRLEWTVIHRLDGLLQGDYRSLFRGFGLDLADLREYQYQDDVRHIDWNVTARQQTPYVREYHEDREITAWFLVDLSPSVDFGSQVSKRRIAIDFVTVMARLLTRQGNRVGAILHDGARTDTLIPARGGRPHVLRLLHQLTRRPALPSAPETELGKLLRAAINATQRRSLIFLVSDFITRPGWSGPLAHLARRHDLISVRITDPLEIELPDLGIVLIEDAESGEQLMVDTHDPGFRRRFRAQAEEREAELRAAFQEAGADVLELSTADNLVDAILRFADLRNWRSRSAGHARLPAHLESAR